MPITFKTLVKKLSYILKSSGYIGEDFLSVCYCQCLFTFRWRITQVVMIYSQMCVVRCYDKEIVVMAICTAFCQMQIYGGKKFTFDLILVHTNTI